MSVFLRRFIDNKKYIVISISIVLLMGIVFGIYQYHHSTNMIKHFFENLFYLNVESYENHYQIYLFQNIFIIIVCTYMSSSYLGHIGILFLLFLKGMQISFSILYTFSIVYFSFTIMILIIIEIILELLLCIVLGIYHIHLSIYVTLITFYIEQNFNIKSMLNYRLNCIIVSLIIFVLSLAFRIYIIPLF